LANSETRAILDAHGPVVRDHPDDFAGLLLTLAEQAAANRVLVREELASEGAIDNRHGVRTLFSYRQVGIREPVSGFEAEP